MNTPATSLDSEISNLICMLREIRFLVPLYLRIKETTRNYQNQRKIWSMKIKTT